MSGIMNMFVAAKTTIATAVDAFFNSVTLLLNTSSTNGAQNNTFIDSSSNGFSITRNPASGPNAPTQGTFTPFSPGWSTLFNGSNQKIASVAGTNFAYGTGAFTVEAFIYLTAYTTPYGSIILSQSVSGTNYFIFQVTTTGQIEFNYATSGGGTYVTSTTTIPLNTWAHVAAVRQGTGTNQFALYINGTNAATSTVAQDFSNTTYTPTIGDYTHTTLLPFAGYISNIRVIKGQALTTGNFTSPTAALTASTVGWAGANAATSITGTVSLLAMQSNRFVDNGAGNTTLTLTGTPSVQAFSPFLPTAAYDTAVVGGSGYFDGTGDYLSNAANTIIPSTGDFTVELWVYPTQVSTLQYLITTTANTGNKFHLYINASAYVGVQTGSSYRDSSTTTIKANAWNYIACTRTGSTYALYVNGVSQTIAGTGTMAATLDVTPTQIGARDSALNPITGYLSSFRVSTTVRTITLPTAPYVSDGSTSLLLNATNAGIYDAASKNVLETVGNAQVSTTQAKFGTTSMAFDGTGDWTTSIDSPNLQLGTGDFTIDGWVYLTATGVAYGLVSKGTATTGWSVNVTSGNKLQFSYTATALTGATSLASGTWYYFAVVRSGTATGNLKVYLNSSVDATSAGAVTDNFNQTNILYVGADRVAGSALNGYLDEVRITKFARTITTPTAAFPVQ